MSSLKAVEEMMRRGLYTPEQGQAMVDMYRAKEANRSSRLRSLEPALTIATGMVAEPLSGLAGLTALPYGPDVAAGVVERTQEALTYQPRTEEGQEALQGIGEFLAPVGEAIEGASSYLGDKTLEYTDSPGLATVAYSVPTAAMELLGLKAARALPGTQYEVSGIGDTGLSQSQRGAVSGIETAEQQGYGSRLYHGTTHDITEFGGGSHNPEGHFGAGHYLTSSADDASRHYAGVGPDLTSRIDQRAEQIANEMDWDYDDPRAIEQATSELKGHEGAIMPLRVRLDKTFDLTEDTQLSYEREVPDWEDYLDDADGDEDMARDMALDDSYMNEPEGELADFMESLRRQADEYGFDADELMGQIEEIAMDYEGISATQLDDIMRNSEWYAEDPETGRLINNEVYRQAIEDAGFDSIVHSGEIFEGMDVEAGTKHTIVFDPSRIRSEFAEFDPQKKSSRNILASQALPAALGAGLLMGEGEETY